MPTQEFRDMHTQVELLLPWYVNGSLSPTEKNLVADHLDDCADCQQELRDCKSLQSVLLNKSPTPIMPQADTRALFQRIDKEPVRKENSLSRTGYIVAAAVSAIAIASLLWVINKTPDPAVNQLFETATSNADPGSMDVVIDIAFDTESSQTARVALLNEIQTETNVPRPVENLVRLTVRFPVSTLEALEAERRQLETHTVIRSVELVALQVPVPQNQ